MLLADYNKGLIVTLHVLLVWCHVSWGNYLPRNNRRKFVRVDNEDRFRSPRIVILGKAYLTDFLMREHSHMTSDVLGVFLTYLLALIRYFTT